MRFQPGQSGNPGGHSRRVIVDPVTGETKTLTEIARGHTKEMLDVLVTIAKDKTAEAKDRITAADKVLARGWGAVKPALEDGDGEGRIDLGQALLELIHRLPA